MTEPKLRIAFLVPGFPAVSETFIINQVADLVERGVDVQVYSFSHVPENPLVSARYFKLRLAERTHYIGPPSNHAPRIISAGFCLVRLWRKDRRAALRCLNLFSHGRLSLSLQLVHWVEAMAGQQFSLVHCHFGITALNFVAIRKVLGLRIPFVATFYGRDASVDFKSYPPAAKAEMLRTVRYIFVMSHDMKARLEKAGAPADKIHVLPVSIDVEAYPFAERTLAAGKPVEFIYVGRLVEKKGADDFIEAAGRLRAQGAPPFRCTIVGSGPLDAMLRAQVERLDLSDCVTFRGSMQLEKIVSLLLEKHVLVQPSKTAPDGEME